MGALGKPRPAKKSAAQRKAEATAAAGVIVPKRVREATAAAAAERWVQRLAEAHSDELTAAYGEAVASLRELLVDSDPQVRFQAIERLMQLFAETDGVYCEPGRNGEGGGIPQGRGNQGGAAGFTLTDLQASLRSYIVQTLPGAIER